MRRPGRSSEIPPPLELACLRALWDLGEGGVKEVQDALAARGLAYTTVMTVLERLAKRGAVRRRKVSRRFLYSPALDREHARAVAVRELVDTYFGGSADALRRHLDHPEAKASVSADTDEEIDPTLL
ncbi:MAG: BlaI/MecI/CopY family transcriptional regulator [Bryobacteraceae bacterium]